MAYITITPQELAESAHKFRRELLTIPAKRVAELANYMTPRPGVTYKETVGSLSGAVELAPYDPMNVDKSGFTIAGRTLETFLGSVIKEFDPNELAKTVYAAAQLKGEELKSADIAQQCLVYVAKQIGDKLYKNVFKAERKASGKNTADLFNGFDTITKKEIAGGGIAEGKGNLMNFGEAITSTNAYEALNDFYVSADDDLQEQETCLYLPNSIYQAYLRDYKISSSGIPYNTQYDQVFLEASMGRCRLVPMSGKKGSAYIHLSPKSNMLFGYGNGADLESVAVEKYAPFTLSFVAALFFGVEFQSIDKANLFVGKLFSA